MIFSEHFHQKSSNDELTNLRYCLEHLKLEKPKKKKIEIPTVDISSKYFVTYLPVLLSLGDFVPLLSWRI